VPGGEAVHINLGLLPHEEVRPRTRKFVAELLEKDAEVIIENSSTSVIGDARPRRRVSGSCLTLGCFCTKAYALDPIVRCLSTSVTGGRAITDFRRRGPRITQTADGYLWIAADKGLVRFERVDISFVAANRD